MATDTPTTAETLALADELERWPWAGQLEPKMARLFRGVRAMAEELHRSRGAREALRESLLAVHKRAKAAEIERDALDTSLADAHRKLGLASELKEMYEVTQTRAQALERQLFAERAQRDQERQIEQHSYGELKAECEILRADLAQFRAVIDEAKRLRALGPQAVDENFDWVEEANRRGNVVICLLAELAEAKSDSERLGKELTAAEADVASLQRVIAGAIEADRAAQGGQGDE